MTDGGADNNGTATRSLAVINRLGLHARAAAKIAETLKPFQCQVVLQKGEHQAEGLSILSLITLDAPQGTRVTACASGPQANEALCALEELFANRFGEDS